MRLQGQLSREHFGGAVWVLRADDGAQYQLKGKVPPELEGCRVEVEAKESEQGFGFSMVGPVLDLRSIQAA